MTIGSFLEKNMPKIVGTTGLLNVVDFGVLLINSLSDGVLTHDELIALMQASSGMNLLVLGIVTAFLKWKKNADEKNQ